MESSRKVGKPLPKISEEWENESSVSPFCGLRGDTFLQSPHLVLSSDTSRYCEASISSLINARYLDFTLAGLSTTSTTKQFTDSLTTCTRILFGHTEYLPSFICDLFQS